MYTIIIPAYKPAKKLCAFVQTLSESFTDIVVVNDGSGSDYDEIFQDLARMPQVTLLTHEQNRGKGAALKTAFCHCRSKESVSGVITVDADGQHLPEDICKVRDALMEHPTDLIMGCRQFHDPSVPARSRFGNEISRVMYRLLCQIQVSDTQTGLRGIPQSFLSACIDTEGDRYEYETNMLIAARKQGVAFFEVPITTVYEENNASSHFHPLLDSVRIYRRLFRYSAVSLLSVVLEFGLFTLFVHVGWTILIATYVARGCSCLFNFTLNRKVVFQQEGHLVGQFLKYIALVIVSGTISGLCVTWLDRLVSGVVVLLKMVVDTALYFMNYYVQKHWVFRTVDKD